MEKKYVSCVMMLILFLASCQEQEHVNTVFVDENYQTEGEKDTTDVIVIPFRLSDGVRYVNVTINGMGVEMILDTGCSSTLITPAEAQYLIMKGKLTWGDFIGVSQFQIANGLVEENWMVNLKEVIIDGKITCPNVTATVSNSVEAPLLLGNEVLDRIATIEIDNEKRAINFKLKK